MRSGDELAVITLSPRRMSAGSRVTMGTWPIIIACNRGSAAAESVFIEVVKEGVCTVPCGGDHAYGDEMPKDWSFASRVRRDATLVCVMVVRECVSVMYKCTVKEYPVMDQAIKMRGER